jgi:hypothetical protein
VTGQVTLPPAQLLLYTFGPDAYFQGQLVGALERIESGGALRILDALFVTSDPETGELVAIDLRGGAGGIVAPLLDFRLDPASRRRATERALSPHASGLPAEALRELSEALEPGAAAMVAPLVEHAWAKTLEDAVSRTGGIPLANEFVDATTLAELAPDVVAAAGHGSNSAKSG